MLQLLNVNGVLKRSSQYPNTVDGQNPAPPKTPLNADSPVNTVTNKQLSSWFPRGAKWILQPSTGHQCFFCFLWFSFRFAPDEISTFWFLERRWHRRCPAFPGQSLLKQLVWPCFNWSEKCWGHVFDGFWGLSKSEIGVIFL